MGGDIHLLLTDHRDIPDFHLVLPQSKLCASLRSKIPLVKLALVSHSGGSTIRARCHFPLGSTVERRCSRSRSILCYPVYWFIHQNWLTQRDIWCAASGGESHAVAMATRNSRYHWTDLVTGADPSFDEHPGRCGRLLSRYQSHVSCLQRRKLLVKFWLTRKFINEINLVRF